MTNATKSSKKGSPTFGISAERSEFRPDVRNFGGTFEILAGRSKYPLDVRNLGRPFEKITNENRSLEPKSGLPEFIVEAILIFWI